jgi:hypothetical protein
MPQVWQEVTLSNATAIAENESNAALSQEIKTKNASSITDDHIPDDGGSRHRWNVGGLYQSVWRNNQKTHVFTQLHSYIMERLLATDLFPFGRKIIYETSFKGGQMEWLSRKKKYRHKFWDFLAL